MRNIEQILRKCENCKLNECDGCITYSDMQVIKARIKELEEDLYSANKIVEEYTDSIPKQKVKDKIELLKEVKSNNIKKDFDTVYKDGYFSGGIDCLEELLEGE